MLTLKKGHELNWFDLKYIESPLMAKRTVQSNHGAHFGGEIIHNGNEHGLPDNRSKVFEPYGAINNKLDNGQVFLINHSTQMPVIAKLEITANNTAKWKLNQGQNLMFLNALDGALNRVQVPKPYGVLRDEPTAAKPVAQPEVAKAPVKKEKKKQPEFKISVGVQGLASVGSSDIRVVAEDFESKIFINNVEKPYGKIAIDSAFNAAKDHREIALTDIAKGKYYTYMSDHTGRAKIPLGSIDTLELDKNVSDFSVALAAIVPMAYDSYKCDNSKPMPLRDGYLYVYLDGFLWREIKVDTNGNFNDVDLEKYIDKDGFRKADTHFDRVVLLPAKLNGKTPQVQLAFSQAQWSWQRLRQLGGMDSSDIRLKDYPAADVSALNGSDDRRKQRMGDAVDLSSWQDGMQSSKSDQVMALDTLVNTAKSQYPEYYNSKNQHVGVGVVFVKESLHWANKAALDHQLAWLNFEEYLDDLKNPKHKEIKKLEEFKFSPYFESALLAHQYFFVENDDMKKMGALSHPAPKRYRGPKRYSSNSELNQAIRMRANWADQLSLPDIEKALGIQKRAAFRERILEEKKALLEILAPSDSNQLAHLKEEIADFTMLEARTEASQDWAYDQLWALVGVLFSRLAQLPAMLDNGMDSKPLSMEALNKAHQDDVGHEFVFSVLDEQHWLSPLIFPKADAADATQPYAEVKGLTDYTCDPEKLNHKIKEDRDFEVLRRTTEMISGSVLAFMDVSADKIGDAHIQSSVRLLHSQKTGLKLQKIQSTMGTFLLPELKAQGLNLDIPELEKGNYQIRAAFGVTKIASENTINNLMESDFEKNGINNPNSDDFSSVSIKNTKGNMIGSVSRDLITKGHGLNPQAWKVLSNSKWHTTTTDIWVLNDQQSLINKVDDIKPKVLSSILPMLAAVELWNVVRVSKEYSAQHGKNIDPLLLANLASAIADAGALALDATKVFNKYTHSKAAYGKGVKVWSKYLLSQGRYAILAKAATALNVVASILSAVISFYLMFDNFDEGDDAWISHGVMGLGFSLLALSAFGVASATLALTVTGLGIVLLGAALLHWVFKEDDLLEQWLENGPFSKGGIKDRYVPKGRMGSEAGYIVSTDYGVLKLDKQRRLLRVIEQGDFEWQGEQLIITKLDPLDALDGQETLKVGKLSGPINLDAITNKSVRLMKDEHKTVDQWRDRPHSAASDLASIIHKPQFDLIEIEGLSDSRIVKPFSIKVNLNGLQTSLAKIQVECWVLKEDKRHGKVGVPDTINMPSKESAGAWLYEWNGISLNEDDKLYIKYKIDVYGDGKIKLPNAFDADGWEEIWL